MAVRPTPYVDCPVCSAYLSVTDDCCWRCETYFTNPRFLWERYETHRSNARD